MSNRTYPPLQGPGRNQLAVSRRCSALRAGILAALLISAVCDSLAADTGDDDNTSPVWTQISAGADHVLAINDKGELYAWGHNNLGQLGNGEKGLIFSDISEDKNTPQRIGSDTDWKIVAAGSYHSLALKNDGTLYTWGHNGSGQLGNNSDTGITRPAQVGTDTWKAIAAGDNYSLALRSSGSLYAWGTNKFGQLGDGTRRLSITPKLIGTAADVWKAVAVGYTHSLAIKNDGTLYTWGNNSHGQLGRVTTTPWSATPTRIGTDSDWKAAAGGTEHSLALKNDGTLHSWGDNSSGQLGDGTTTPHTTPTQIGTDADWKALACGGAHSLAVKSDGGLYTWGSNRTGQLGINNNSNRRSPSQVEGTGWDKVIGGRGIRGKLSHSLALKSDGTLYSWGYNMNGQLGNGPTGIERQRLVPTIVPHP